MTFLDSKSQTRLEQTFSRYDMSITVEPDYIVVDNSQNQTVETIQEIVREAGFDPIRSDDWNWLTTEVVSSTKQCGTLMSVSAFYLKLKK